MGMATAIICALSVCLVGYVLLKGLPHLSWRLLTTAPSYLTDTVGILPDILNTLYIVVAAVALVLPLGIGAAVYLNEYATNKRLVGAIEYAAETLSGIPSIIYGMVGMLVFSNLLGSCLLAGALTLVVMNLPTVMRTTQESLKTVPQSYREGAFGLGAGKWRVIRTVVLPGCVDGVVTGCILFLSDRYGGGRKTVRTATVKDVLLVGAAQGLATIPGLSRSGTTISVGMLRGFDRSFAVRFSFLMSLPAVLGANVLEIKDAVQSGFPMEELPMYLVGVAVSAVVGYFAIRLVKTLSDQGKFGHFAYYCWAVGLGSLLAGIFKMTVLKSV